MFQIIGDKIYRMINQAPTFNDMLSCWEKGIDDTEEITYHEYLIASIPSDVMDYAKRVMNREENGQRVYEYADNLRIARLTNVIQTELYQSAHNHGCCGYFDTVYQGEDFQLYVIGFNYGH